MLPEKIGRYEIISEIGRGRKSVVHRAFDTSFKREVALKLMLEDSQLDPMYLVRFRQEAAIIASLEHPAIVPVYDFGEYARQPFLVMRLMRGGRLADRIQLGRIPLPETARIFGRIAPALDYAHRRNILHGDLRPDNILFDERNEPYLTDFQIATPGEHPQIDPASPYLSPEQARGAASLDVASDTYSLGVMLYQMLTGQLPAVAAPGEAPPDIRGIAPELPESIQFILERCLAPDPGDRYRNIQQIADDVNIAAAGSTTTAAQVGSQPTATFNHHDTLVSSPMPGARSETPPTVISQPGGRVPAGSSQTMPFPRPTAATPTTTTTPQPAFNQGPAQGTPANPTPQSKNRRPGLWIGLVFLILLVGSAGLLAGRGWFAAVAPQPTNTLAPIAADTREQPGAVPQSTPTLPIELTLTAIVQELNATLTAVAFAQAQNATPTPEPLPTETPTPTSLPALSTVPAPEKIVLNTTFGEDPGFFAPDNLAVYQNDALYMGPYDRCDLDAIPPHSVPSCLLVCTACGESGAFRVEFDVAFSDGRRSDNLFGAALRFTDENGNGRVDKEDYFLGWGYSVNIRTKELPLNDRPRWFLYEHLPNQAVNPWRYIDSEIANLTVLPRDPNRIKFIYAIETYYPPPPPTPTGILFATPTPAPLPDPVEYLYIEIYMNDVIVGRIVNYDKAIAIKQARYVPALPMEGWFGLWVAEGNLQARFDTFRYTER